MQKDTLASCSLGGCGCSSSALGGGAAAILLLLLPQLRLAPSSPRKTCLLLSHHHLDHSTLTSSKKKFLEEESPTRSISRSLQFDGTETAKEPEPASPNSRSGQEESKNPHEEGKNNQSPTNPTSQQWKKVAEKSSKHNGKKRRKSEMVRCSYKTESVIPHKRASPSS